VVKGQWTLLKQGSRDGSLLKFFCNSSVPGFDVFTCASGATRLQFSTGPLKPNPPSVSVGKWSSNSARLCSVDDCDVLVMLTAKRFNDLWVVSDVMFVFSKI